MSCEKLPISIVLLLLLYNAPCTVLPHVLSVGPSLLYFFSFFCWTLFHCAELEVHMLHTVNFTLLGPFTYDSCDCQLDSAYPTEGG